MPTPNIKQRDKVLIIDDDSEVRMLLREQILNPGRFEVYEAIDGPDGLEQVKAIKPDLIILDLVMPGLSGSDFLVALKNQGSNCPVVVTTKKGNEMMAIDAFRLGASDFFTKPIREAEALRIIEQATVQVRLQRERRDLDDQLKSSNQQLEARLKELTTLSNIGRNVTTVFDLEQLFGRILEAAIYMTEADHASLLLLDEASQRLILRSGKNLTLVMQEKLGEPVNDELASLVMKSGQPFAAAGEGMKRFKVTADLNATIYAPLMLKGKVIGVLTVGNHKKRRAFDDHLTKVLEILADYAAIGIANARLFNALESRARTTERAYEELKAREIQRERLMQGILNLREPMLNLQAELKKLSSGKTGPLVPQVKQQIGGLESTIAGLLASVDVLTRK